MRMSRCRRMIAAILIIAFCCGSIPVTAASNLGMVENTIIENTVTKNQKISDELLEKMDEVADSDSKDEKIPICIWYEDIDDDAVEAEVEARTGLTKESLDTDLEMPSERILNGIAKLSDALEVSYEMENLQSDVSTYLKETNGAREYERELTKRYSKAKREVSRELFAEKSTAIIAELGILEKNIIFKSEYSPFIIMEAEEELIKLMEEEASLVSIDLFVEENGVYMENAESVINDKAVSKLYNTMSRMKEVNGYDEIFLKTGLSGEGVELGMIEQCVPSKELDFTGEIDESKYYYLSTDSPTDEHATNTATIICGTESLSYNISRLYCASMNSEEYTGRDVATFCQGMEELITVGVHVINCSTAIGGTSRSAEDGYSVLEAWLDYMVDRYDLVYVQAAGNYADQGDPVCIPGLSYNVITVGFLDDMNTENQNDDTLYAGSCYDNGNGCVKPDVVITGSFMKGGTSSAAPLVVSIIALMLELKPSLEVHPQLIKAILMASCHRKVLEPTTGTQDESMIDGLTEKQGAGVVDPFIALCIIGNKQYGERELGYYEDYIHIVQPKYDSKYMNVSVAWHRQFPVLTENPTILTVPTGTVCDIELHINDSLNINVGSSVNSKSSTEMAYFPITNNVNNYTLEVSKYVTSSKLVTCGYAWSTDAMEYQIPTKEGIYFVRNKLSKHCLGVDSSNYLIQDDYTGASNQQWVVNSAVRQNCYKLTNEGVTGYIGLTGGEVTNPSIPKMISSGLVSISLAEIVDESKGYEKMEEAYSIRINPPNTDTWYALQPKDSSLLIGSKLAWVAPNTSDDTQKWHFDRICYRKGDVNKDGQINSDDISSLQNYISNVITYTEGQKYLADVNGDGAIDSEDVTSLTSII